MDLNDVTIRDNRFRRLVWSVVGQVFRLRAGKGNPAADTTPRMAAMPPEQAASRPLIVMLHGYYGSAGEFHYLCSHLQQALGDHFDLTMVPTLDVCDAYDLDCNHRLLDDFLSANGWKQRPLFLVGHSFGGLLARDYVRREGAALDVRALVLIATANDGINAWNLLPLHWTRSMGFGNRFNTACPARREIDHLLIAGTRGWNLLEGLPNDGVVSLRSVRRLQDYREDGANIATRAYPLDHWELLRSEQVAGDIAAFLDAVRLREG